MDKERRAIIFVYNTAAYLFNFRIGLMTAMRDKGWKVIAASPFDEVYSRKIERQGIRFFALPLERKGINPLADLPVLFRLALLYRRENPLIVHHFTIKPVIYGSVAARLAGIPGIVNHIPGLGYVYMRGGILKSVVERMYRASLSPRVHVIFQNPDDLEYFLDKKMIRAEQAHLICGSGIDTQAYSPAGFPDRRVSNPVTFTLVARMLWDKGIAEFIAAAALAHANNAHTRFVLIGNPDFGNPAAVPSSRLKALEALDYIEWIGHKNDIRPFLAESDVIVLPSYREGAPRVLIEAAAMAKPIITTDVPGCREIVTDGENGLLVPHRKVVPLAEAMVRLAEDSDARKRMGQASREKALRYFDERIIIQRTQEIYARLTDG